LDRRTVPGENQFTALEQIEDLLQALTKEDPTFHARAEIARPDWKWDRIRHRGLRPALTSPDSPIALAVAQAHHRVTGEDVHIGYTNGYNDGDFLMNDLNIPTVNYGPGESHRSHTVHEQLRIDQLLTCVQVYLHSALLMAR
jgi:acetylornithine deacetylase/succinyl-diaminopimelate desuccinylase-like protein